MFFSYLSVDDCRNIELMVLKTQNDKYTEKTVVLKTLIYAHLINSLLHHLSQSGFRPQNQLLNCLPWENMISHFTAR